MSVKLRLLRMGRKKLPFYRIVAVDSRTRRDGKYIEKIGTYDPLKQPAEVNLEKEVAMKWLLQGAIPSDTVRSLLSDQGIMMEYDFKKRGLSEEQIEAEMEKRKAVLEEKRRKEEAEDAMAKREAEKKAKEEAAAKAKAEEKAKAEAAEAKAKAEAEKVEEEKAEAAPEAEQAEAEQAEAKTEEPEDAAGDDENKES